MKDDNVSIVLTNIEFQKALETLLRQENHFYKIIDERTILIAADTPQNRKTYEDLVIRTFFLSNADVTEVANALRALLQTTRISVNKAENSVTLRDTADKVAVAERIVEQNDKQVAEVVVDVELLQINTDKVLNLGLLIDRTITATIPSPAGQVTNLGAQVASNAFTWNTLKQININSFAFTLPSATLSFIKDNTDAELLAKPQLRIAEGQKAQLLIGDKVPIPVTSFSTSNISGGNVVPVTSYQYQDVGIKIEVEPRVHHNKEVTLKLMTEVSNINGSVGGGTTGQPTQPIIGTRTISSNIRLKDGETNFLAGLYRTDKSNLKQTIPFIGDLPIIGRLFTMNSNDKKTTDLVLTLTPHIIRIPDVTEEDVTPYYVGTDANISYQGGPRVENPTRDQGPFEGQPGKTQAPAGGRQPAQPAGTPAINLAPSSAPSDIFRPAPAPPAPPAGAPQPQPQPPSGAALTTDGSAPTLAAKSAADVSQAVLLDFDPAYISVAPGATQTVMVRATGAGGLPGGTVSIRFDPSVIAVLSAKPILGSDSGMAEGRVDDGNHVVLAFPGAEMLGGTRALAEITVRGISPGRSAFTFDPLDLGGVSVTPSQLVVDVK